MKTEMQSIKESIKIPSDVKHIKDISSKIVDLLMKKGTDKSTVFDIRLCVEEAILNAIEHGNKYNKKLTVDVSFAIYEKKIEVSIEDKGKGFSHVILPDPTSDDNVLRAHGRGVYIIHKLMDKVEYNEKGNKITFMKYLK